MRNDEKSIHFLKTKFGLFLSFLVMLILIWGLIGFFQKLTIANDNKKQEEAKLEFYENEKSKIEARLADVNSEEVVEKTARENYNLAKEGEGLVVIIEEENLIDSSESKDESVSLLDLLRKIFGKNK